MIVEVLSLFKEVDLLSIESKQFRDERSMTKTDANSQPTEARPTR